MHLTAVPEEEDRTTQRPPQRSEDLGHGDGLNVVRLPAEVEAQVLTRGGYREGGQSGEAILLVVVGHERCVPLGRPGPATRGEIAGHWERFPWAMAASSRWRARRSGT